MENKMFWEIVYSNGIFCVLFTGLFVYVMRNNREREQKLFDLVFTLVESLKDITDGSLREVKDTLHRHIEEVKKKIGMI